MSTAIDNKRYETAMQPRQLEVNLPAWCALKWYHALTCSLFVVMFLYFCYVPVASPTTWSAVAAGQIAASETDGIAGYVPLSRGIRSLELGWVGRWLSASVYRVGGSELLSISFAVVQTSVWIVWSIVFYRLTRRWLAAWGAGAVAICCYQQLAGFDGESLGQLAMALLALLLSTNYDRATGDFRWSRAAMWKWCAVLVLFVVWSNCHASFVVGGAWLVCLAIARLAASRWQCGSIKIADDEDLRSRIWLCELAWLTTLCQPHGLLLWKSVLWWPDHPLLTTLGGWSPPIMAGWTGVCVGVAWLLWVVAARHRGHLPGVWVVTPIAATIAVACCGNNMIWAAPLMTASVIALWGIHKPSEDDDIGDGAHHNEASTAVIVPTKKRGLQFAFTLVTGLVLWLGFCFSPLGSVLGGSHRSERQVVGNSMPCGAKQYCIENQPAGLVFCPNYWSDFLRVDNPVQVMANTDMYRLPEIVIADYGRIYRGQQGWTTLVEKYAISDLIIDKAKQPSLTRQVRRGISSWKVVFEDAQTLIVQRS
ncbi:MAG: hypothetical protein R3E01_09390 [Pirellulaceae bacterium]